MENITKPFMILAAVFLLEALLYNVIKPDLPQIPGDLYINRFGIKVYIPFVSALVLSVILTVAFFSLK